MTRYVVVTRQGLHPIERFMSIDAAANYIVHETKFGEWKVLAQDANKITASTPYRELRPTEKHALEAKLFPTLYD